VDETRPTVPVILLRALLVAFAVAGSLTPGARAQELEPRSYSASPIGVNFVGASYAYSSGAVVVDASLPLSDVSAYVNGVVLGWGRTFGLVGRQALVTATLPYAFGDVSGAVFEQRKSITRSGLADFKARLAVNLYGNPAQKPQEFARRQRPPFLVGTSLTVTAPSGQYYGDKLINLGTNRWAFKPEIGVSVPWRKLDMEAYAGAWFFTDNPDFYPGGQSRQQDPLSALQGHMSYTFRPSLWIAADGTWYGGGAASVSGGPKSARLDNSRLGVTLSLPLTASQSAKLAYSRGALVRAGSNFSTIIAGWQLRWF
jgi:outer membrane putative beta-barrel porin/alpha-amylase